MSPIISVEERRQERATPEANATANVPLLRPLPNRSRTHPFRWRVELLWASLAIHLALLAVFLLFPNPAKTNHPEEELPIEPPVPLQMVMVDVITTPGLDIGEQTITPTAQPPVKHASRQPMAAKPAPQPERPAPVVQKTAEPVKAPAPVSAEKKAVAEPQTTTAPFQAAPQTAPSNAAPTAGSGLPAATQTSATGGSSSGAEFSNHSQSSASASSSTGSGSGSSSPARFGAAYLNNPAPKYPSAARRMGQQGRVFLRVLVTASGLAKDVRLQTSSGHSLLDNSAISAVRRWRFVPAKQGGSPVEAWVQVPIVFTLD